jgi:hypothetical protein
MCLSIHLYRPVTATRTRRPGTAEEGYAGTREEERDDEREDAAITDSVWGGRFR